MAARARPWLVRPGDAAIEGLGRPEDVAEHSTTLHHNATGLRWIYAILREVEPFIGDHPEARLRVLCALADARAGLS
jgi:hypothetical protein